MHESTEDPGIKSKQRRSPKEAAEVGRWTERCQAASLVSTPRQADAIPGDPSLSHNTMPNATSPVVSQCPAKEHPITAKCHLSTHYTRSSRPRLPVPGHHTHPTHKTHPHPAGRSPLPPPIAPGRQGRRGHARAQSKEEALREAYCT